MRGIHTALVTPFADDGSVDLDAYARLAQRQLDGGITGLVPCGTTGETPTLNQKEWEACIRVAVEVSGSAQVTAGVGTNNTATTVANIERAATLGADAALVVFPYYNKPNPRGLRAHVHAALAPGLPVVLYHVPGRTGQRLPADLLAELANMPGVIGVKEATGDIRYGGDLMLGTDTPVLSGDDFTFLGLLAHGGTGCISVVSNVDPVATVAIQTSHEAGDHRDAAVRMRRLLPLIDYLFQDTNPVPCKAVMAALGLCLPTTRLPLATANQPVPRHLLAELTL
jgi:4-hydroxy-tetrahydrodipicolinate synthase